MADQKAMKKRLKALMARPENQVCSDCPERQPRWASLIVAPPGAPPGTQTIGAFCCLECSGSHRRLGVHISFVRSINLDSWKEHEVRAMENGGNAKVNSIFEARLSSQDMKPSQTADGRTRERYIRDKYERRKFFDPAGYSSHPAAMPTETAAPAPQVGPPSDAAKKRMEQRRARKSHSSAPVRPAEPAPAPASAPVDLLDLFALEDAPKLDAQSQQQQDLGKSLSDFLEADKKAHLTRGESELAPPPPKQLDIMSLYNRANSAPQAFNAFGDMQHNQQMPQQQQMNQNGGVNPSMMMHQYGSANHMTTNQNGGANQMMMMNQNGGANQMMMNQNGGANQMMMNNSAGGTNGRMGGDRNSMQHPQQQQMMMTPQQQQQMYQQMMMMQQQQQMMMMQQQQQATPAPTANTTAPPAPQEKEDPFAHFSAF